MRVFAVDDSPEIVQLLTHYFRKKGHEVVGSAYDGETALKKAKTLDFDILVIDYMLGDITGYDVALQIQREKDVKIIIITSDDSFTCDEFPVVRKPFRWHDFERIITGYQN